MGVEDEEDDRDDEEDDRDDEEDDRDDEEDDRDDEEGMMKLMTITMMIFMLSTPTKAFV